ncbi:MAG: DNA cytosine methyltransferase [Alphaproteobacteria bacterium]|nr:DNA cytosine methyltransferase [Alphaproteobacteria bacterium]MBR6363548.1 DNA cytosine methyltransferase [Alphaproteobacteria bacterium]
MAIKPLNYIGGATAPKSTSSKPALPVLVAPTPPATPAGTAAFITSCESRAKMLDRYIQYYGPKSVNGANALNFARYVSGMALDKCVEIADEVRALGQTKGSGKTVKKARIQKDEIMVSNGFLKNKLWRSVCELDADCVSKAKAKAVDENDFPTMNSALTIKRKNKPTEPRLGKYDCHGIFSNTVLPNDIKFDKTWNATSLFANIGLGTYMLKDLNINVAVCNELIKKRTQILQEIYPGSDIITGDIMKPDVYQKILAAHKENNCRIVLFSAPCQNFSKAGKQNIHHVNASLVMYGMQFVEDSQPDVFMSENVPEFLGACPDKIKGENYKTIYDYMKQTSDRLGYITNIYYLDADNYGTGEKRERSIVLGIKKEFVQKILGTTEITDSNVWKFPKPDEFKVSEEICLLGIPSIEAGEHRVDFNRLHFAPDLEPEVVEALKNMPAGQTTTVIIDPTTKEKVKIKRAHGDRPAPTITGESSHSGAPANYFPAGRCRTDGTQSDARYRTPYEILVLMGMPRDFELPENIKIQDGKTIWCKDGAVPDSKFEQTNDDIVVSDEAFRTMLGEHFCPTVVHRCFKQLIYQIQNKDF